MQLKNRLKLYSLINESFEIEKTIREVLEHEAVRQGEQLRNIKRMDYQFACTIAKANFPNCLNVHIDKERTKGKYKVYDLVFHEGETPYYNSMEICIRGKREFSIYFSKVEK